MKKFIMNLFSIVSVIGIIAISGCDKDETNTEEQCDFTPSGSIDEHDFVDLGLSVKWATCNVGANSLESSGNYYAWQETTPTTPLTHVNYKYNFNPCSQGNILASIFDAATVNWGSHWRMPTEEEMEELCSNCTWTWVDDFQDTGVPGCIVKSKINNKSIFLPAVGYTDYDNRLCENEVGFYWTSYAGPGDLWKGLISAMDMTFYPGGILYGGNWDIKNRSYGLPVRAVVGTPNTYFPEGPFPLDEAQTSAQGFSVSGEKDGNTYVDLALPSRTLWATCNVGANNPREYGNYYAWGETSPKEVYIDSTYAYYGGSYFNGVNTWNRYTKYTWYQSAHGTVDGKLKLDPIDDAATQNMGSDWAMPTMAQLDELIKYLYWSRDGSSGWIGTSKINGHTFYLPNAGWEYNNGVNPNNHLHAWYWSSEIPEPNSGGSDYDAYILCSMTNELVIKDAMRIQGLPVRGVTK
ncbi:MAG: hypothetical protein IK025_05535 [Bacteroidales bacterium]|nr:hypothetical protein [Bacteroidales bacterium]